MRQEDCEPPKTLTIREVRRENVAPPEEDPQFKGVMYFEEEVNPLVLNVTNAGAIFEMSDTYDTDEWSGLTIEVYRDPDVGFSGKRTGGIRVRRPSVDEGENETASIPF